VYQVNLFVDTICASWSAIVGSGAVAALYYANRLFQFPLAIVGTALAQASLPLFSLQALEESPEALKTSITALLKVAIFLAIPAMVGLVVLGEPIVAVLFERGEFDAYSTAITARALVWYATGLVAYMAVRILTNGCYALRDTVTPVRAALAALVVNVGLNLALMRPLGVGGLALATSVASAVNATLLFQHLARRLGPFDGRALWGFARRVLYAAAGMGIFCGVAAWMGEPFLGGLSAWGRGLALLALIVGGIGVFAGISRGLKVDTLEWLWSCVKK